MARLVAEEGLDLDVATGGELHVALHAGFPAERIVLHGNNKSSDELRAALDAGVGRIVVDSFDELDRLEELAARGRAAPRVLVRVTPGVEAHTHEYIETGTDDSKFGFTLSTGDALRAVQRVVGARRAAASPGCTATSARRSSASTRTRRRSTAWSASCVAIESDDRRDRRRAQPRRRARRALRRERRRAVDRASSRRVAGRVRQGARRARRSLPARRSMVEPGRSIAAPSGLTLYRSAR